MTSDAPHPDSVIRAPDGRAVFLKVHRCLWSGEQPENSLPAILECYQARVARAEIDIAMLHDADFLVTHDATLESSWPTSWACCSTSGPSMPTPPGWQERLFRAVAAGVDIVTTDTAPRLAAAYRGAHPSGPSPS